MIIENEKNKKIGWDINLSSSCTLGGVFASPSESSASTGILPFLSLLILAHPGR